MSIGKTTLVDKLYNNRHVRETSASPNAPWIPATWSRAGIAILASAPPCCGRAQINIVDTLATPDLAAVERILSMVDGAIVLVDAAEGPMPQTKFVVGKALKMGLKPIVAINKVDKPDGRPSEVVNEVFDLFAALDATDEQLDFPILYGSAKQGWMADRADGSHADGMAPLFDLVIRHVAPPKSTLGHSACSAPSWRPIPISAACHGASSRDR
jgi:GTP-binding protein